MAPRSKKSLDGVAEESANSPLVAEGLQITSGIRKYPSRRDEFFQSPELWLEGKREDDGVSPYWRVHDGLYDLTDFIHKHPGGRMWLECTQGMDVTEFFESSHFGNKPQKLLKKYWVKDIRTPRISPFTFHDQGFYKTLKRKVTPILDKIGTGPTREMLLIQDTLLLGFLVTSAAASFNSSAGFAVLAGAILALMAGGAHNFFHQKDNWRMLTFDLTLSSARDWRVSHALSHHHYPNTILDYEVSVLEPYLYFLPKPGKPFWASSAASGALFVLVSLSGFFLNVVNRLVLMVKGVVRPGFDDGIRFGHLGLLVAVAGSVYGGLRAWLIIHVVGGFLFLFLSMMAAHQHPDIYHEGDVFADSKDWGLLQVLATRERGEVFTKSVFLSATTFGNHTLHHLFPTVDHSKLPYLQGVFLETCREFGVKFQVFTPLKHWRGVLAQLRSVTPNENYPSILKG